LQSFAGAIYSLIDERQFSEQATFAQPGAVLAAPAYRSDEVSVKFKAEVSRQTIAATFQNLGVTSNRYNSRLDTYLLKTPAGGAQAIAESLRNDPNVEWVDLNYIMTAALVPTDPDYSNPTLVYAPQLVNAENGWDITTGSASVIVAVVDSGISLGHPEFAGRIIGCGASVCDFVNNDSDPSDDQGHGTHVAGIIAAAMNNGAGAAGLAPGVRILPVKVLDNFNNADIADVAAGVTYAADNGAKIINLSLGGFATNAELQAAVEYACSRDILVVTAAGNFNSNSPFYPAAYPCTVAVAGTDRNDARYNQSNYGSAIDLAAPGVDIWSSLWTSGNVNTYGLLTGTSMSAPHVSGLAALLLSSRTLASADMRAIMEQSAVDLGTPSWDQYFGNGRINVGAALNLSLGWTTFTATPTRTPTPTSTPTPTNTPIPFVQRVNAGGTTFADSQGQSWAADKAFTSGSWGYTGGTTESSTKAVNNTVDDALYQKYRASPGEYRFTAPNGAYVVTLKFAEFSVSKSNTRVMRIIVEGTVVENALDIYKTAGRYNALDRSYNVTVNDGVLNIVFAQNGGSQPPIVSAVEVKTYVPPTPTPTVTPTFTRTPTPTPCQVNCPTPTRTPTPTATSTTAPYVQRVNSGGTTFTDSSQQGWAADKAFSTGSWGYTTGSAFSSNRSVDNTVDDKLYQKYRELVGEYKFTAPNGNYEVRLKFAEFSTTSTSARAMVIKVEGIVVEGGLSIYAVAGRYNAYDTVYTTAVTDGVLNIAFARAGGATLDPAVSAVQVRSLP
jgi:thermitase